VRVVVTGMGQVAARAAAEAWVPRVQAVVVCGVAGGCGGAAGAGDVVVASGLLEGDGSTLGALAEMHLPETVVGLVASTDAPVDSAEARAALRRQGVLAVETEAAAWAAECARTRVPLAVVRGVLDTPEAPLGPTAGLVQQGARGPKLRDVAPVLRRPGEWGTLLRVGRAAALAERRAAEVAVQAAVSLQGSG
jgi:nucleoside phosphorylase